MRLFIEVPVPEDLRGKAAALSERFRPFVDASFVRMGNMHLTLKFLGEVPEGRIAALEEALSRVRVPPFGMELSGVGTFPTPYYIRVLWFGALAGGSEFVSLQKQIDLELAPLKFPPERSYVPHLTFARVKRVLDKDGLRELIEHDHGTFGIGSFRVSGFSLMESRLSPDGPEYRKLFSVEF